MFNNQQVGAKAKRHKLCKNNTEIRETVFDISVVDAHGNAKTKKFADY